MTHPAAAPVPFATNVTVAAGTTIFPQAAPTTGVPLAAGLITVSIDTGATATGTQMGLSMEHSADGGATWLPVFGITFTAGPYTDHSGAQTTVRMMRFTWPGDNGRAVVTSDGPATLSISGTIT